MCPVLLGLELTGVRQPRLEGVRDFTWSDRKFLLQFSDQTVLDEFRCTRCLSKFKWVRVLFVNGSPWVFWPQLATSVLPFSSLGTPLQVSRLGGSFSVGVGMSSLETCVRSVEVMGNVAEAGGLEDFIRKRIVE